MPIYEYHCNQCDRNFEVLVRNQSQPACPGCGSNKLGKKMSAFAVVGNQQDEVPALCTSCGSPPGSCAFDA